MKPGAPAIGRRGGATAAAAAAAAGSAASDPLALDELISGRVRPVVVPRLHLRVLEGARSH